MTAITAASALTPKQQQVFDLIAKGEEPPAIAKRLKISTSGVYGHIRNIKAAGITLPDVAGQAAAPPAAVPDPLPSTAVVEPRESLRAAIAEGRTRSAEIDTEIGDLHQQIERLTSEKADLGVQIGKYETALEALS